MARAARKCCWKYLSVVECKRVSIPASGRWCFHGRGGGGKSTHGDRLPNQYTMLCDATGWVDGGGARRKENLTGALSAPRVSRPLRLQA